MTHQAALTNLQMTNSQQTQIKAIAILIGIIGLIVAMNKSMIVLFTVLITPILLLAYGGIYLMLIRNQKREEGNHNELIDWYYNQVNRNKRDEQH